MPVQFGNPILATFGDSFVFGDEISDNETWQTYLAALFQRDVYNMGVKGFFPDQALLHYRRYASKIKTP